MTRRGFLLLPWAAVAQDDEQKPPDTPYNRVANAANPFHRQYIKWANTWNSSSPGLLNAREIQEFEPLHGLWRKVEQAHREWVKKWL